MNINTATVYAITTIYIASSEFADKTPYTTAILETAGGRRFLGFIKSGDKSVSVGDTVALLALNETGYPVYSPA